MVRPMLKKFYATEAEIPEAHKAFYAEKDGKWVLQVEGMVDVARVAEFRDENVRLKQELEKFKDIDPAKYADALAKAKDVDDGKLIKKEGFDAAVQSRVAEAKAAAEAAAAEAKKKADDATKELEAFRMSIALRDAGSKMGLRKGAEADLEARGRAVLRPNEQGTLIAHDPISGQPLYDEDAKPMTHEKWLAKLVKDAPHLFEPSNGAGGRGAGPGATGHTGPNPFSPKSLNLTEQGRILRENPALAERLKQAAAVA